MRRLCKLDEFEDGRLVALDRAVASEPGARTPDGQESSATIEHPAGIDSVLAIREGTRVRMWQNVCPHAGRRLDWAPGRFLREGAHLVCAHHGAVFELQGGRCVSGPCRGQSLVAIEVEVRDGEVWIADPEA